MPEISFEVTNQEYQTLAALAALKNLSIEAYLVECISNDMADKQREQ